MASDAKFIAICNRAWAVTVACVILAACGGGGSDAPGDTTGDGSNNPLPLSIVAEAVPQPLTVDEGGQRIFRFKLSARPTVDEVTVSVSRVEGDEDISVSPSDIVIAAADWDVFVPFTAEAALDDDSDNGNAIIRAVAPGIVAAEWIVSEVDTYIAPGSASIVTTLQSLTLEEGARGTVGVKLDAEPPTAITVTPELVDADPGVTLVDPAPLTFTADNWQAFQSVSVRSSLDTDQCGSRARLRLTASNGAQREVSVTINDREAIPGPPGTFTLCGTIAIAPFTDVDGDINDELIEPVANNAIESAQVISNPVTVGGYVNAPGTGPFGRSYELGDVSDFYSVRLAAGQQVVLYIGDALAADLDLFLWNSAGTLIDFSIGTGEAERLTAGQDGNYFIEVASCATIGQCAAVGGSNYVLTVGQPSAAAVSRSALRMGSDFVPGEAIIKWAASATTRSLSRSPAAAALTPQAVDLSRAAVYKIAANTSPRALVKSATRAFADERTARKYETLAVIKALRAQPDVAFAEPNYYVKPLAVPNDPMYNMQWHYPLVHLPAAWDLTTGSADVIVAVVDSGVLLNHPDMVGQTVPGYDFISSAASAGDGNGRDPNPDDPGDQGPNGSTFHGTHVAGTIAAATNNNQGVAGVAWGAKIMPLRVLGRLGGTTGDVIEALQFAAGLANDSNTLPARRADILNLSFGSSEFSDALMETIQQVRQAGVIVVAAAGNERTGDPMYPAGYPGVVAVSAVGSTKQLAPYSNFGAHIAVAAPGGDLSQDANADGLGDGVLSTGGSDRTGTILYRYPMLEGTSMAAPHVAGIAALMKSVFPGLTPDIFDDLLASGKITEELGPSGRDEQFGYGLIDAFKAVFEARTLAESGTNPSPRPPSLVVQPSALNFGFGSVALDFRINNSGGATLRVESVKGNQPWLSVVRKQVDTDGLGIYTAQVNRRNLADGNYSASIAIATSDGAATVDVLMGVFNGPVSTNTGSHYVLLLPKDESKEAHTVHVLPDTEKGEYRFAIDAVAPGDYFIFAGSDMDQDGILCDPGEACGALRTLDLPELVTVTDGDKSSLNFGTAYLVDFGSASLSSGTIGTPGGPIRYPPPR